MAPHVHASNLHMLNRKFPQARKKLQKIRSWHHRSRRGQPERHVDDTRDDSEFLCDDFPFVIHLRPEGPQFHL